MRSFSLEIFFHTSRNSIWYLYKINPQYLIMKRVSFFHYIKISKNIFVEPRKSCCSRRKWEFSGWGNWRWYKCVDNWYRWAHHTDWGVTNEIMVEVKLWKRKLTHNKLLNFIFLLKKNLTYSKVKLGSPEGTKFDSVCLAISGGNQDAMVENITLQLEVRFLTFFVR